MDLSTRIFSQLDRAIRNGRQNQVKRILNAHGLADRKLQLESFRLLRMALKCGHYDIADLLLDHNCKVNTNHKNLETPLHIALRKDAKGSLIKKLLSKGASITARDQDDSTALHLAVKQNRHSIVKLLIQSTTVFGSPQHYINALDFNGSTALQLAVEGNHHDIAALLLENHADPDNVNKAGITATYTAAMLGNEKIFELLVKYKAAIDIHAKLSNKTILHHSVLGGRERIVELVFKNCDVNKEDFQDLLSIALKAVHKNVRKIELFLIERGFRCSAKDVNDTRLVSCVIRRGYVELFKDLLEFGLDLQMRIPIFSDCECRRNTLLHEATFFVQKDIAEILLLRGAHVNATNDLGDTPLCVALQFLCGVTGDVRPSLERGLQFAELLLAWGACTDNEKRGGFNALYFPTDDGSLDVVSLLLDYDANPDNLLASGADFSVLQKAILEKNTYFVKLFLANGSDITILEDKNQSSFNHWLEIAYGSSKSIFGELEKDMMNLLQEHATKLLVADFLAENTFPNSFLLPPDPNYQEICARELTNLKNDYFVNPSISFFAILTATQNELVENLSVEMFMSIIDTDVLVQYPVYGDIIRVKVRKAVRRKILTDEYSVILSGIFSYLPQTCVRKILSFFNNQELRNLICNSKIKLTSEELAERETHQKKADITNYLNERRDCICRKK